MGTPQRARRPLLLQDQPSISQPPSIPLAADFTNLSNMDFTNLANYPAAASSSSYYPSLATGDTAGKPTTQDSSIGIHMILFYACIILSFKTILLK
jgi:hypothetical protein